MDRKVVITYPENQETVEISVVDIDAEGATQPALELSLNHDMHGWEFMAIGRDIATNIATALGAEVEVVGEPCV